MPFPASVAHSSAFVDGVPVGDGVGRADDDPDPDTEGLGREVDGEPEARGLLVWVGCGLAEAVGDGQIPTLAQSGGASAQGLTGSPAIAQAMLPKLKASTSAVIAASRSRRGRWARKVMGALSLW